MSNFDIKDVNGLGPNFPF